MTLILILLFILSAYLAASRPEDLGVFIPVILFGLVLLLHILKPSGKKFDGY